MNVCLRDVTNGAEHDVALHRLIVAGFTGRDSAMVVAHVDELRELGVPVPDSLPSFYVLDPHLVTNDPVLQASGPFTSGEVEPVVVVTEDRWWLGVGSDHTDRDLEATSIEHSKAVCPKPVSTDVVCIEQVPDWDAVTIRSWADGKPYQSGSLAELLALDDILAAGRAAGIEPRPGDVLFLGTVPVTGGLRPAERFRAMMAVGVHRLEIAYRIEPADSAKPPEQGAADG